MAILLASATIQFDFFGFTFFILFIIHGFAYYSFRIQDEPIDILKNLRKNKINIRGAFAYMLVFFSAISFFIILVGQAVATIEKSYGQIVEGSSRTGYLKFLEILSFSVPHYDSLYTLSYTFVIFLLSLLLLKTRNYEEQVAQIKTNDAMRSTDPVGDIEAMRNYQIQKAVQLIKDYKFKSSIAIQLEMLLLAFISSVSCTVLVLPYALIFIFLGLIMACGSDQQLLRKASNSLNLLLLALLLVDLPGKYILKGGHMLNDDTDQRYLVQVIGLLSSNPTYVEFYLKIVLFLIECQKLQFSFDYHNLLEQIKTYHSEKQELTRVFRKRLSFKYRICKPISLFMFCSIAIIYSLMHPSALLFILMPMLIFGFFMEKFRGIAKFYIFVVAIYTITAFLFNISELLAPESQVKEEYTSYIVRVLGVQRDPTIFSQLFPNGFDFFLYIIMAFFVKFICKQPIQLESIRRFEEDLLTIPDDLSESRSKLSLKTEMKQIDSRGNTFAHKMKTLDPREQIAEDRKEQDKEDDIVSVASKHKSFVRRPFGQNLTTQQGRNIWNIQKDDTLRGRMRRYLSKIYLKLKYVYDKITDMTIIHCSKIALFAMFAVSVSYPNLFNALLFILFLWFSISHYSKIKQHWNVPIIVNSMIILTMYGYDVFCPSGIQGLDQQTLHLIGITYKHNFDVLLSKYVPYLLLLGVLIITYYVLNSVRYEEFLNLYEQLEMKSSKKQRLPDEDEQPILFSETSQPFGLSDPITKFIIKNSLYLMVLALFIECSLLPVSILNFILLTLMTIIVMKYFLNDTQLRLYQNLSISLGVLKYVSLIFIFLKYMFQFEEYAENFDFESNLEMRQYFEQLPLIEKLLGIENSYVPIKLFSLALVLVLSNLQLKFLKYKYLVDILKEEDNDWNRLVFLDPQNKTKAKKVFHYITIYTLFFVYYMLFLLPIVFLAIYSYAYMSLVGYVLFITALFVMYSKRENFWKTSYKVIGVFSSFALLFVYILQFLFFNLSTNELFINWVGVTKENATTNVIYDQLIPVFLILLSCALQKLSSRCESLFQVTMPLQEIKEDDEKDGQMLGLGGEDPLQMQVRAVVEFEEPIRQCINFRDNYLIVTLAQYGYIILNFVTLVNMLWKLNLSSLVYLMLYFYRVKQNYYPQRFAESQEQIERRVKVSKIIKLQVVIVSFIMIVEYFMSLGPTNWLDITSWKQRFAAKLCLIKENDCIEDWKEWLSLSNFPPLHLILDFILLISSYLNLFFAKGILSLNDEHLLEYPKINDEHDFISSRVQNKFYTSFMNMIFGGFPYFLIAYLMFIAASFHGSGMADLISMVYLCLSFYYIINFRKLYTQNQALLSYLRSYNFIVLFLILAFQSPAFMCPAISNDNTELYINKQECGYLTLNHVESIDEYGNEPIMAFYIVLTQSIGLFKQNEILFNLIFLILMTEIQNQLFGHPYFYVYVLQHMKLEKQTDGRLRAFMFVEKSHLHTLWAYQAIKEEIKILHQRLVRIMNAIRTSEFSRHLLDEDDDSERQKLISDDDKSQSSFYIQPHEMQVQSPLLQEISPNERDKKLAVLIEKHAGEIENLALEMLSRPDTPIISLKLFNAAFRSYLMSLKSQHQEGELESMDLENLIEEYLSSIVLKLQKQVHLKNRLDLYSKESIGLNFAIQKGSSYFLNESEFAFYYHLILSKAPNEAIEEEQEGEQQEFEVRETYEEFLQINDRLKEVQKEKYSIFQSLGLYIRSILWTKCVNKLLFYSLTQGNQSQVTIDKIHILSLLGNSILSQSQNICYLMLFINFILNANLISLVLPLSALLYGLLDHPIPNVKYWKYMMIYVLTVIGIKFLYQLPIFCGTPHYSLFSIEGCSANPVLPEVLIVRLDYIIGVHKFAGPSSYPHDEGILNGIICDLLVLFALLLHKNFLIKVGIWHYVRTKNDIQQNPSFKCKPSEVSETERLDIIRRDNFIIYEYEEASILGKLLINLKCTNHWVIGFLYKLMPNYLPVQQKNLDLRTQKENPHITLNYKRIKPGKDYFSQNFFALLLILIFNLFFFRSVTGESQQALPTVNLQRFSVSQVIILFLLLLLMMIERMLYRTRQLNSSSSQGVLNKHALTIKYIIHIVLVVVVHLELGFAIPKKNQITMSRKFALIVMYLLYVLYFVFSALQIKHGYPQAPFKPPFSRDTSFFKVLGFRIYKAIPFLWEMKVIIDWTVTTTCLDLFQWFKFDDAFNYLFANQFQNNDRKTRSEFEQRPWYEKFFQGFCFAFGLVLVILAPILLFSGINPIMIKNPVLSASLQLSLEMQSNGNTYQILQSQAFNIAPLSGDTIETLNHLFIPVTVQFDAADMQKMSFSPYSESEWSISPPSLEKFIDDFRKFKDYDNGYVEIKSSWTFKRENPIGNEVTNSHSSVKMKIDDFQPIVDLLIGNKKNHNQTANNQTSSTIFVEGLFPKMLKLGASPVVHQLEVLQLANVSYLSSSSLTLNKVNDNDLYWTFKISESDHFGVFQDQSSTDTDHDHENMVLIVQNEEVIGSLFGSSLQLSVVGIYATIVIAIGRFIRLIFDRISQRMIYEEMPDTEQLFEICEGIFIAQLEGDLVKEKRLYDLLIRMYRSPETLIKITGAKLKYRKKSNRDETRRYLSR